MSNQAPPTPKQPHESTETLSLTGDLDLEKQLQDNSSAGTVAEPTTSTTEKSAAGPHVLSLNDAENPRNWSTPRKVIYNMILCTWVLALTYASTAYIASVPELIIRFNISPVVAILGVTLTVLGFAAGPLVFAPASEVVGRRPVYLLCGLLFSAFSWGAAEADDAAAMLICRFFLGFFGAASINNVPASIGDFTFPHNRNRYSIVYATMAFGGPALGPLCSAYIERYAGFRWNLRVMAIFATVTSLATAFVPETHGPTLLARQVARAGHAPPPAGFAKVVGVYKIASSRPIIFLFTEPIVTLISIYLSTLYGILYGFFQAFSVVFIEIRGFSTTEYGNSYIALGLGFLMGSLLLATVGDRLYSHFSRAAAPNPVPPEARLGLAYFGAIVTPISLLLFAWTAPYPSVHWIVPCIAEALFAMSMLCIFTAFIPYLIDVYTQYAASALAAGMASRALIGSVFPLFALQMYRQLTVQGATSLLAGLSICLAPIPFIFAKYGPRLRAMSKYSN